MDVCAIDVFEKRFSVYARMEMGGSCFDIFFHGSFQVRNVFCDDVDPFLYGVVRMERISGCQKFFARACRLVLDESACFYEAKELAEPGFLDVSLMKRSNG